MSDVVRLAAGGRAAPVMSTASGARSWLRRSRGRCSAGPRFRPLGRPQLPGANYVGMLALVHIPHCRARPRTRARPARSVLTSTTSTASRRKFWATRSTMGNSWRQIGQEVVQKTSRTDLPWNDSLSMLPPYAPRKAKAGASRRLIAQLVQPVEKRSDIVADDVCRLAVNQNVRVWQNSHFGPSTLDKTMSASNGEL